MNCKICETDIAIQKHHILPKSRGGRYSTTVDCCYDCGNQIHMLFTNKELASMTLSSLLSDNKMKKYIKWKRTHPGSHKHKMSKRVKNKQLGRR